MRKEEGRRKKNQDIQSWFHFQSFSLFSILQTFSTLERRKERIDAIHMPYICHTYAIYKDDVS